MIRIGKIAAVHGTSGSLVMVHTLETDNWLKPGNILTLELKKGSFIPFLVTGVTRKKAGELLLQLEDITDQQEAKKLVAKPVYADEALLKGMTKTSPLLWIGFQVNDEHYGNIGKIEDVMQTGAQWIAKLTYKGAEAMIPLVDATIRKLDTKSNTLYTRLPEGLLEIYE